MSLVTISTQEMVAVEENAEYLGVSSCQLMECAGRAVADKILLLEKGRECVIFAGSGKNGGDGMVAARHLASRGFRVTVVLIGGEEKILDPNVKVNWEVLKKMKSTVELIVARDSSLISKVTSPILVDALLGTGIRGALSPPVLQAVKTINSIDSYKVAVDIPTGVDATTGETLGEAVKADLTVTFHKLKTGMLKAKNYAGEVAVADVGIPQEAEMYAGPGDVKKIVRKRLPTSHKGDFGKLIIVGGSETYVGAPTLAALAALRVGVDLVYVASPEKTAHIISSFSPNLITLKLEGEQFREDNIDSLKPILEQATALIVGPGLGVKPETFKAVRRLADLTERLKMPMLIDADGLKALSPMKHKFRTSCVVTPHAGEFSMLIGKSVSPNLEGRTVQVKQAAEKFKMVVLLKSNIDLISDGIRMKLNWTGNPGMTVGGTGDVLSGIVGGFLAQGIEPFDAAVAGAFINGAAGDSVAKKRGFHLVATDLIDEIPTFLEDPMKHKELF